MKKIIVFIFVCALPFTFFSQDNSAFIKNDSIDALLKASSDLKAKNNMYEALEKAFKAVDYAHKLKNDYYISYSYFMMGIIQYEIIDYENAKKHLLKSLEYTKQAKEKKLLPYILHNLANIYYDNNELENAVVFYKRAIELGKQNPETGYQTPLNSLIWTYMDLNRYDQAAIHLKESDSIDQFVPDSIEANKSSLYMLKGRNYAHLGDIEKAEKSYEEALKILERQPYWPKGKSYLYQYRSEMYEDIGEYAKAVVDLKLLQENDRKVFENAKLKNTEIAKIRFEVDEYERKLEVSEREKSLLQDIAKNNKIIIYISLAGLVLLIGAVFFYYKSYESKKKSSKILESKNIELNEAKSQAEKLSKVRSKFISTVSHELRTPLYGVVGISSLLLENNTSKNDKKLLNSLKFSADYLLDLVNKVLKISKIDAEQTDLIKTPTNLCSLSQNILQSFEYQSEKKENELLFDYNKNIPNQLDIDALRISEILINLIGNAIKFTSKGKIWLRIKLLSITSKTVCIRYEIEDTGIGIPDDQKDYIFEEFSQAGTVYDNKQGTGLGLSIVKNLLEMMDSKIHFESKKGVGSKFYFNLDLEISENADITDNNIDSQESSNTISANILVAEDNKINQLVTKNLLKLIGCDCVMVENGFEAVEALKRQSFDLVLMDINMPVLDGMQATIKIRKFDDTTPIIALTASELSEVQDECLNAGMNDLLNKPLNKINLKAAILKNLALRNPQTGT
ncbi:response regulator [Aquimarina sp. MMG016]|uniref:tetratricopeptide repeat-containing hybrid sensor histidine kinase/response regulator n=1 Tax=Aquimarina sp. MMG016 TaxID=2822690 RepID=UPI001B3A34E0|nr:response regulator [Aquimarina sp. MMG016]MBQ4818998.1 response regulator [Aquimarina sp. MMG016]